MISRSDSDNSQLVVDRLSHGITFLMHNLDQLDELCESPELMGSATQEILCYSSLTTHFRRTATRGIKHLPVKVRLA
ncbi:MAG TPA: hypothetical protein VGC03_00030 [Acidimicrobiia bacterium]|jgi:cytochrome P450